MSVTLSVPWMPGVIDRIPPDDLRNPFRLNLNPNEKTLYLTKYEPKQL